MGGYDIGEANKFDFIMGHKMGNTAVSMGAMQGEFGVGLSYDLSRDFKLYSQLYDFDDAKVRVGGELHVLRLRGPQPRSGDGRRQCRVHP